jgi:hypothetical protein
MPHSTLTISTTQTMATVMVTPRPILQGNNFLCTSSVLHKDKETVFTLHELIIHPPNKDIPMNAVEIGGRTTIINVLKKLLNDGIVMPLLAFYAYIVNNEQDCCIKKATVEPMLEQAAARIAAVVEAECPTNQPILKSLIQDNVDKRRKTYATASNPSKQN